MTESSEPEKAESSETPDAAESGNAEAKPAADGASAGASKPTPASEPAVAAEPRSPTAPSNNDGAVLITASGLTKHFGQFTAIRNVSFSVYRGEVVAFLGPNGAGKSTTMKCLTGVLAPDEGLACIAGEPVLESRLQVAKRLGYMPENGPLYQEMTPEDLLWFFGEARGLDRERIERRIEELKRRLSLGTVMGKAIHKLSRGYRQRVGLAQVLLHEPDVLILDEPTAGLDPNQIRDVRRTIREFGENRAVLLSTHILQEVEAVCDRVIFIDEGEVVFQGSVDELKSTGADLDDAFAAHTVGRRRA